MNDCILIKNLHYSFPLGGLIFKDVNLSIKQGEFVVFIGENGAGKSTLINLLLGFRTAVSGDIAILGMDPKKDALKIRQNMFFISHAVEYDEYSSIGFILKNISILYPSYSFQKEAELLDLFGLKLDSFLYELSLGQKVRVQIIAAIASQTPLILIDEITAVLDPAARKLFSSIILNEKMSGRTIIMATNIPDDLEIASDRVIHIQDFKVVDYESK